MIPNRRLAIGKKQSTGYKILTIGEICCDGYY